MRTVDELPLMHDVDHDQLYAIAESQSGYFTARQALEAGMSHGPATLAELGLLCLASTVSGC